MLGPVPGALVDGRRRTDRPRRVGHDRERHCLVRRTLDDVLDRHPHWSHRRLRLRPRHRPRSVAATRRHRRGMGLTRRHVYRRRGPSVGRLLGRQCRAVSRWHRLCRGGRAAHPARDLPDLCRPRPRPARHHHGVDRCSGRLARRRGCTRHARLHRPAPTDSDPGRDDQPLRLARSGTRRAWRHARRPGRLPPT